MLRFSSAALGAATSAVIVLHAACAQAATEKVLYSFCSQRHCSDGEGPRAGLLDVNGVPYGATGVGGDRYGEGTLFSIDPGTGAETVLYAFGKKANDGQDPNAGLAVLNGIFYGTTTQGGASDFGTVFSFDPGTGIETVLHSFDPYNHDGVYPQATLVVAKGVLYGVTYQGGGHGLGDIFSVHPGTGKEKIAYSFPANNSDGYSPVGALLNVKDALYGTTTAGANGQGTVFSFDPRTGTETTLYAFCPQTGCADGKTPSGGLIEKGGTLYGVTSSGGAYNGGTVFAVDPASGTETVLYSFCAQANCSDGAGPSSGLLDAGGILYGTTGSGGSAGKGTVFALDPATGNETVLYAFQDNGTDGWMPNGALVNIAGKLYGTTYLGGSAGGGIVFKVKH